MSSEEHARAIRAAKSTREQEQFNMRIQHAPLPASRSGLNFNDVGPLLRDVLLPMDVENRRKLWRAAYAAETRVKGF
jgi:hypothetical protein